MRHRFILATARHERTVSVPRRGFIARMLALVGGGALIGRVAPAATSPSRIEGGSPFVGELSIVGFNFAPVGWAMCDGQYLLISDYDALFSLIGTTYGGDGVTTFALPNLNGRAATHQGQGPGLSNQSLGELGGAETVTLTSSQLPVHSHSMRGDSAPGTSDSPAGRYPAKNAAGVPTYGLDPSAYMGNTMLGYTGANYPHNNMQPFLTMNFIISLNGIYPTLN